MKLSPNIEVSTLKARCSEGLDDTVEGKAVAGRICGFKDLILGRNASLAEVCAVAVELSYCFGAAENLGCGGDLAGGESQDSRN